jgi:hypothetical protein
MPINGWPDPIEPLNHEPRRRAATRGVAVFQGRQRTVSVADERKRPAEYVRDDNQLSMACGRVQIVQYGVLRLPR